MAPRTAAVNPEFCPKSASTIAPLSAIAGRRIDGDLDGKPTAITRWLNEVQMFLHLHPVNEARQMKGQPAINSLWLDQATGILHIDLNAAFVAEMDFGTAPPVAQALQQAIAGGRTGYPTPALSRELAEACAGAGPQLSMGMTGDFEVAVEEGATLVRVGSAIFGAREYPPPN